MSAIDTVPDMSANMVLVSGPIMDWEDYDGCQRGAIIGASIFEGLASNPYEADAGIRSGRIKLASSQDHGTVGSLTGVCSASMPVLVVRDRTSGRIAMCRLNEGGHAESLTFGSWNACVDSNLKLVRDVIGPALGHYVRMAPIALMPMMVEALSMGDEMHGRQNAAGYIFRAAIQERIIKVRGSWDNAAVHSLLGYLVSADFHFLHVAMAAAKVVSEAAADVPGSSILTAMSMNEKEFAIRVAGAPGRWFRTALPPISDVPIRLVGRSERELLGYSGGDSLLMETLGLGAVSAAAAPCMSPGSVGTPQDMSRLTESMYDIAWTEHPNLRIPALRQRGVPFGFDVDSIAASGLVPPVHIGATLRRGGIAGTMYFTPPLAPFIEARDYLRSSSAAVPDYSR
ncbi:DUF1116 domain-containing protein [Paenarthrobacter sp. A20]|uniref:oxamate carbamoyltransferase subunit AllG family protein n=1 Tax=Paenarthrobacter sp. A20 TaxID=2817891 RepID=UPI00209FB248|nr:DUF1116 domain-containing protein [Paenarthrobacter sp. A20]MCP1414207.1 hypothetical protein [Paenarthrobacter sp. A20]